MDNAPTQKPWGHTTLVTQHTHMAIHFIRALKGGYSSEHRHARRANEFLLIHGVLLIREWYDDTTQQPRETILNAGQRHTCRAGTWHQFAALEDCNAYELYYHADGTPMDHNGADDGDRDIERRTTNGRYLPRSADDTEPPL